MDRTLRAVDRQRFVVHTYPVAMRVCVREDAGLKHLVGRKTDAGNHVGRRERCLLDLSKVVFGISIQFQFTDLDQGILRMRPDLGQVEGVEAISLCLQFRHDLNREAPFRIVAFLDGLKEILGRVIRIRTRELNRLFPGKILNALFGLKMEFHPDTLVPSVDKAERVTGETVHVAVVFRRAPVAEKNRDLMKRLWRQRPEVPHYGRRLEVGLRVALLSVNEVTEFQRITDEEDGSVVADQVPVTFLRVELDREAARVTRRIGGTFLTPNGRESNHDIRLLTNRSEDRSLGVFGDVSRDRKRAKRAGALGMDHPLGDPLPVEVGHLFDQMKVLYQHWTAGPGRQRVLVVGDRDTGGSG